MNIKDIAKIAGTSVSTVSRIINHDERVAKATRQKVLQIIEQSNYRPNTIGQILRRQSSKKLLIMIPSILNPFYADIVRGFEEYTRQNGYIVLLAVTNRDPQVEKLYYDVLFTKQVDGVASFLPTITFDEIKKIASEYPFVACCWRGWEDIDVNYVSIDNEKAVIDMMRYLIGLGHTRIAALNGDYPGRMYEADRARGYKRALAEAKIPFRTDYYIMCEYSYRAGYQAARKLMELKDPPTAIFALADERAAGVLKYLTEHGLRPGVDVDVIGFDDIAVSEIVTPALTTVAQPRYEIGREAASLLLSQIQGGTQVSKGIILSHKLVIRDSTRKPGANV